MRGARSGSWTFPDWIDPEHFELPPRWLGSTRVSCSTDVFDLGGAHGSPSHRRDLCRRRARRQPRRLGSGVARRPRPTVARTCGVIPAYRKFERCPHRLGHPRVLRRSLCPSALRFSTRSGARSSFQRSPDPGLMCRHQERRPTRLPHHATGSGRRSAMSPPGVDASRWRYRATARPVRRPFAQQTTAPRRERVASPAAHRGVSASEEAPVPPQSFGDVARGAVSVSSGRRSWRRRRTRIASGRSGRCAANASTTSLF